MRTAAVRVVLPILGLSALPGCTDFGAREHPMQLAPIRVNLVESTGMAVDRLLGSMSPPLGTDTTILVASFADLNELTVSTKLGRLIAEEAAEHLIQRGYRVPEVRLTSTLHVREGGEFMLSREIDDLKLKYQLDAGVVLTGTVTSVGGTTYVNFRLIRLSDGIALAASDLELSDRIANR
jgi:TolB-like protein